MSSSSLLSHLQACLAAHPPSSQRFVLALSGGMDSRVLLDLMAQYQAKHQAEGQTIDVIAVHVHHGLSKNADTWAQQCQTWSQQVGIPCVVEHVTLSNTQGESIEQLARHARYQALAKHVVAGDVLLTAQHGDDQMETFLLALKRGSGPAGLAAMPVCTAFGNGKHVRPLLTVSRADIEAYATAQKLDWVEDESNQDTRYDRNFLRHHITPQLAQRWPGIRKAVGRSAALCGEQEALLAELLADKLASALQSDGSLALAALTNARLGKALIRQWLQAQQVLMPSQAQLEQVWQSVVLAKDDANPQVNWHHYQLRRYAQRLYLIQQWPDIQGQEFALTLNQPCLLPQDLGQLWLTPCKEVSTEPQLAHGDAQQALRLRQPIPQEVVTVRFDPEGLQVKPLGRVGKRKMKKLFQEYGVPSWNRRRTPLVFYGEQLAAVAGLFVVDGFAGEECELTWHNSLSG